MRAHDLRERSREELEQQLGELKEELFNLRFRKSAHQDVDNPLVIRGTRRDIARIRTILTEDEQGIRALKSGTK